MQRMQKGREMITLNDFRKIFDDDYEAGREVDEGPGMLIIDGDRIIDNVVGYTWYIWDGDRFQLLSLKRYHTAQAALDDLLACNNPVATRALKEVFGDKYEEPKQ